VGPPRKSGAVPPMAPVSLQNEMNDLSARVGADAKRQKEAPGSSEPDSLCDALLFLAAFHNRAMTREAMLFGLPIKDNRLSIPLFDRAARRAGLEVESVERPLGEIPAFVLPAVLILQDQSARILSKIDTYRKKLTVINPSTREQTEVEAAALESDYLGHAFLVRPAAASERTPAAAEAHRSHWFWSVVRRFWANYSHIAIAAFIVNVLALAAPLFTMNVYDRVVPNGALPSLIALSIGLAIAIAFDFLLRTVRARIIDVTGKKLDVILASDIFEHVLSIKMAQRPGSVGILANQMRDFDAVREFFTSGTVVAATDLLFALLFIALLFVIAGPLAWIPVVVLPVMIVVGLILQRPLNRAVKRLEAESSARHGVLVESLSAAETVRVAGAETRMQRLWEKSVVAAARTGERAVLVDHVADARRHRAAADQPFDDGRGRVSDFGRPADDGSPDRREYAGRRCARADLRHRRRDYPRHSCCKASKAASSARSWCMKARS
jgi:ATP-binding cassette, subfamily C, bacterial LapB